jgi:hypothetical protein
LFYQLVVQQILYQKVAESRGTVYSLDHGPVFRRRYFSD